MTVVTKYYCDDCKKDMGNGTHYDVRITIDKCTNLLLSNTNIKDYHGIYCKKCVVSYELRNGLKVKT